MWLCDLGNLVKVIHFELGQDLIQDFIESQRTDNLSCRADAVHYTYRPSINNRQTDMSKPTCPALCEGVGHIWNGIIDSWKYICPAPFVYSLHRAYFGFFDTTNPIEATFNNFSELHTMYITVTQMCDQAT